MQRDIKLIFARWFRNIDFVTLGIVIVLMFVGLLLIGTADPAISYRIGSKNLHFFYKQIVFIMIAIPLIILCSIISSERLEKFAKIAFVMTLAALLLLPFVGEEVKGAVRWLKIMNFSIQPSEFLKPTYAVVVASILSNQQYSRLRSLFIISLLHCSILAVLFLQPDFGMAVTISFVTFLQFFIANTSILLIAALLFMGFILIYCAYLYIPHVHYRIDSFLNKPGGEELYQASKSLEAHYQGKFLGKGIGEGSLKFLLPDSHTDFIFSVCTEELGAIFGIFLIGLFTFVTLRCMLNIIRNIESSFHIYAAFGAVSYIVLQSILNIAVTLNLLPTKGVTLPFISYGGCSLISMSICIGIYLNASRASNNRLLYNKIVHIRY